MQLCGLSCMIWEGVGVFGDFLTQMSVSMQQLSWPISIPTQDSLPSAGPPQLWGPQQGRKRGRPGLRAIADLVTSHTLRFRDLPQPTALLPHLKMCST